MRGREGGAEGGTEVAGNLGGAGAGTFRLSGRIDPQTGAPSVSVVTQRPALPLNIEKILSQLAGAPVRTAAEHTMVVAGGRIRSSSMAFDPGLDTLSNGPFFVEMAYGDDRLSLSAGIPPVEIDLHPYHVVVSGGFRIKNDVGTARLQIHVHEGESADHLEEADLLLYDLRIDGDTVHAEGSLLLADGREFIVTLDQGEDVVLTLAAAEWDLAQPWRLPWALAGIEPPALEGTADMTLQTTIHADGADLDAIVNGTGLAIEGMSLAGASARLKIRRSGARTAVTGAVNVSRDNALVSVDVSAEGGTDSWAGTAAGTARWNDRSYAFDLSRWSFVEDTFVAEGEVTLPGGARAHVRRAAWNGAWSGRVEVENLDLSELDPRMVGRLPVDAYGGVIDAAALTWGRDSYDLSVTSPGGAWIRSGDAAVRFTKAEVVRDEGSKHNLSFDSARVTWRDIEFETPRLSIVLEEDRADELDRLPLRWTLTLAGGRFLRRSRFLDTEGAPITIAGEGIWNAELGMLEGTATVTIEGWGESIVRGWTARRDGDLDFGLTFGVHDVPLRRLRQALGLVMDADALQMDGTLSGHVHAVRDAAGFSVSGEIANADIVKLVWEDWTFEGVTVRMPLEMGVARDDHPHEHAGLVTIRQATYPGGSAKGLSAAVTARRDGEAWSIRSDDELGGTFCNGTVGIGGVDVTLALEGPSSARLRAKIRGLDLAAFSELIGMDRPLTGTFDADYADVRVGEDRIDFGGGKMTGQGLFSGTWTIDPLWIEDPFGPDTSYGFRSAFDDVNLRHVSRYLIDSSITHHGLIHGRAEGEFHLKMLHDGGLESFEVYAHSQRRNDVRQFIYRDAARTLASTFGRADLAREMKQLPERTTYYGLSLFAKMGLDGKVWMQGGYYRARAGEPAREYTLEEIRARSSKGEEFMLIGSGLHNVDIPVSMIDQPIDWETFQGRLDPDAAQDRQ